MQKFCGSDSDFFFLTFVILLVPNLSGEMHAIRSCRT